MVEWSGSAPVGAPEASQFDVSPSISGVLGRERLSVVNLAVAIIEVVGGAESSQCHVAAGRTTMLVEHLLPRSKRKQLPRS